MWTTAHGVGHRCLDAAATRADVLWHNQMREVCGITVAAIKSAVWHHGICVRRRCMMNHSGRHATEVHRDGASSRPQPAGECTPTKYMDETPPNTRMPFHAAINRSEGAFWCVGVHSHIFISTVYCGEESGATATKGKQKHLLQHFTGERQEQHKPNYWLHQHNKKMHKRKENKLCTLQKSPTHDPGMKVCPPQRKNKTHADICQHLNRNTNKRLTTLFHSRAYF
ncbi:hypothetical protein ECC02_011409 [Trypanosoma cruzi]|uniref:Uncharacterized protein n=1 Tax=Trypanosoma cruzi TaxID=5693 RepID=A0A7J6XMY1_TRYCR|nr:hypothetical protein ECC02_011409 [Trypanosoma cruzi]